MTAQEQELIDAIWGKDASASDLADAQKVIAGINEMADIAQARFAQGKIVVVPNTDYLH